MPPQQCGNIKTKQTRYLQNGISLKIAPLSPTTTFCYKTQRLQRPYRLRINAAETVSQYGCHRRSASKVAFICGQRWLISAAIVDRMMRQSWRSAEGNQEDGFLS